MLIRDATPEDVDGIAEVTVLAWKRAYPGLMPQDYLDALTPADRAPVWRQALAAPDPRRRVVVAAGDEILGFAAFGAAPDGAPASGQLYAVNVRPARWSAGVGGALLAAVHEGLHALGHRTAMLWVVAGNPRAIPFYEHRGWTADGGAQTSEYFGFPLDELRYRRALP